MEHSSILHSDEELHREGTDSEKDPVFPPLPPRRSWIDDEEEHQNRFGRAARWVALLVLVAALAGAGWYIYPLWQQQGALPAQVASLKDSLLAAGKRADAAEEKMSGLVNAWGSVTEQMRKLESRIGAEARVARKQTRELVAQMQQRVMAELDQRMQSLTNRVSRVEEGQASEQTRVAKLEQELATVRAENAQQRALLRENQESRDRAVDQKFTNLDQRVDSNNRELAGVHTQIDRQRVDFEAGVNHSKEVAPGVTLQVSHTDVAYQRFQGWVFLMPDRRTVWLHDQGVQRPLVLYSAKDNRPVQLVVTRVTKYSVVGYLLIPESQS